MSLAAQVWHQMRENCIHVYCPHAIWNAQISHRITMFWWYDCSPRTHNWAVMSPPLCLSKYWEVRIGCQMGTRERWLTLVWPSFLVHTGRKWCKVFNSCPGFHVLCLRNTPLLCLPFSVLLHSLTTTRATPIYNTESVPDSWPQQQFYSYLKLYCSFWKKTQKLCLIKIM